jgi:hypothetical protein
MPGKISRYPDMQITNSEEFRMNSIQKNTPLLLSVAIIALLAIVPSCPAQSSEKNESKVGAFAPSICLDSSSSDYRCSNLIFYSPDMWLAVRYDAQDGTFAALTSDKDGPGLWDAKQAVVTVDSNNNVIFRARTVLRSIPNVYVDWIDWKITVDTEGNAVIEETNPDRKVTYNGKALPIATFNTHKFP